MSRLQLAARSPAVRYLGALGFAGAAVLSRWLLLPFMGRTLPFAPVYPAALAATRLFGVGPGILTVLTAGAGAVAMTADAADPLRLITFLVFSSLTVFVAGAWQRASKQAAETEAVASERLSRLWEEASQRAREEGFSAQLRAIVESSEDAVISKDLDGRIQSWNRAAEGIFGYTVGEAIGLPLSMLLPSDRPDEETEILERIRRGGHVKQFETVRMRKDGKSIQVSLTVSPIHGPSGQIIGISQIARDISERRAFEEQLRQTQKLESLGVLAGGLAHDFNNLLTGIMGNASLVMDDLPKGSVARTRASEILQASERAALLIRQMLAYAGKGRFVIEKLDLSAQVNELMPLLRTSVPRTVEFHLLLEKSLPAVEADRAQMQQLIMNLAMNAAEAIERGRGTVSILTQSRTGENGPEVLLQVSDDGCGMSAETRDRIFDPFFTTKFTGRGLGLAAVMGIIRAHHGSISVDSIPGRGSKFTVVLPALAASAPESVAQPDVLLRGSGKILVIDDEELVRNLARSTLEECGYSVDVALDGRSGFEKIAAEPAAFTAILLDLTMPVMDGEEALRRIREISPVLPVVVSSGFSESEALARFSKLKASAFLQKPYTGAALAMKIRQAAAGE